MTGALFLPQPSLNAWLEDGHVDMGHDALIFTADRTQIPAVPAVRFAQLVDGQDGQRLMGKVKAVEALRLIGGEVSLGTVMLGDAAYQVDEGYLLTVELPARAARPPPKGSGQEADLLAQFILNKLS
jgi:hypothetical protein